MVEIQYLESLLKVKFVPFLNRPPRHEYVWGTGGIDTCILNFALDGSELSTSRPSRFNSV
jgi:hypothetical protein